MTRTQLPSLVYACQRCGAEFTPAPGRRFRLAVERVGRHSCQPMIIWCDECEREAAS